MSKTQTIALISRTFGKNAKTYKKKEYKYNLIKVHYTQKSGNDVIETGIIRGKSVHDCFLNSMGQFGHCIGAVKDDGETKAWVFSRCDKNGDSCKILITHCELL